VDSTVMEVISQPQPSSQKNPGYLKMLAAYEV
jgi:hypothetical protein